MLGFNYTSSPTEQIKQGVQNIHLKIPIWYYFQRPPDNTVTTQKHFEEQI